MADLIINNAFVICLDDNKRVFPCGGVVVEKGRISYLGDSKSIDKNFNSANYLDAKGSILFPGLVNSHTHLEQTILRGLVDEKSLYDWLGAIYWLRSEMSNNEAFVSSMLSCAEMIKSGTTCVVSHQSAKHDEVGVKALDQSGLRGVIARFMCNYSESEFSYVEDVKTSLDKTCKFIEKYNEVNGRVRCAFGPIGYPYALPQTWKEISEKAKQMEVLVHSHISENEKVVADFQKKNTSDVNELFKLGALSSNTSLAHGVFLNDNDIDLLAKTQTSIIHCPSSNMKFGLGVAPVSRMSNNGVNVALGTDGAPSNNSLNMFHEMKIASLVHRVYNRDPLFPSVMEVLRMATLNGAKSIGMEADLGIIALGKKADLILIDWEPSLLPKKGIISNLVNSASGLEVNSVIVEGELIMQNRQMTKFDEKQLLKETTRIQESIISRIPEKLVG